MTFGNEPGPEGEVAMKTCPMCAESIRAQALVCKNCGYDYRTGTVGGAGVQKKANGFAVASMVMGIVWVYWIGSILAVIFGHIALKQINESNGTQSGRGMAIAGLVLGYIGIGIVGAVILLAIIGSSVGS
jgi:hypothetical protein